MEELGDLQVDDLAPVEVRLGLLDSGEELVPDLLELFVRAFRVAVVVASGRIIVVQGVLDELGRREADKSGDLRVDRRVVAELLSGHPVRLHGEGSVDALAEDDVLLSPGLRMPLEWSVRLSKRMSANSGDLILLMAGPAKQANLWLSAMRNYFGDQLGLVDPDQLAFCFVTDFPLFEWLEDESRWHAEHHPFTSVKVEDFGLMEKLESMGDIRARAYDLVLNGWELGGGSIRIHDPETQTMVFNALGISKSEAESKFGFILEAFKYGAPPHGGMALGIDRIVALMGGVDSIREVIAFPKNKHGVSLVEDSPSVVDVGQLKDLHLKLDFVLKEG